MAEGVASATTTVNARPNLGLVITNIIAMGPNQNGSIDRYLYDSVNRLASARFWVPGDTIEGLFYDGFETGDTTRWDDASPLSGLAEVTTTQSYSYDAFGNLQEVDTDGVVVPYTTDSATNRLSAATYDPAGNVTSYLDGDGVTVTLIYDALNRLIQRDRSGSTESWRFLYTADDERIAVVETTSGDHRWTLRDLGGLVLREFDYTPGGTATRTRDQIYRGGSLLASTEGNAPAKHYSLDHLGSPRVITDAAGALVTRHKYYPFGEEATVPPPDDGPMKFTGHERDFFEDGEGNDLDYMHARYCDPLAGRFLSVDPVLRLSLATRSPQQFNRFAYAGGNPLKYIDATGLFIQLAGSDPNADLDLLREALLEVGGDALAAALTTSTSADGTRSIAPVDAVFQDSDNPVVSEIASLINDQKNGIVLESHSGEALADYGGAKTGFELDGLLHVRVNPAIVGDFTFDFTPNVGFGAGDLIFQRSPSVGDAVFHEIGHAAAVHDNFSVSGDVSHQRAVEYENLHRSLRGEPARFYSRKGHGAGTRRD